MIFFRQTTFCISEARAPRKMTLLSIKPAKPVSQFNAPTTRPTPCAIMRIIHEHENLSCHYAAWKKN